MNITSNTSSLQAYNLSLYRTALHPEFFSIEARRRIEHGDYETEAWTFRGGHAVRFEFQGLCLNEVVTDDTGRLPDRGHVTTLQCAGERDHDAEFSERIIYMTSMQTETLSEHLYLGTYNEMREHALESDGLLVMWDGSDRPNLSLLDSQRFHDQIHFQSYHLRGDCGLVLRTQTIFQIKERDDNDDD